MVEVNHRIGKPPETHTTHLRLLLSPPLQSALRQAAARPVASAFRAPKPFFTPVQIRLLSEQTRQAIDKAVGSARVVLFMKGTPETPQCGFSRASIQVLGMQGVDPAKFAAFNVLEDAELRSGMFPRHTDFARKTVD